MPRLKANRLLGRDFCNAVFGGWIMPNSFEEGDILECRIEGSNGPSGTRWNNIFHYRVNENLDSELTHVEWLTQVANAIGVRFASTVQTKQSEQCTLAFVRLTRIAPDKSVFAISATSAGPGSVEEDINQPDEAVVITWRSDYHGGRFRGRTFMAGIPDSYITEGLVGMSEDGAILAVWEAFAAEITAATVAKVIQVIWSAKQYSETENAANSVAPIVGAELDRIVRRQVRRDWKGRLPITT